MRSAIVAVSVVVLISVVHAAQDDEAGREAFTAVALSSGGPRSNPVAATLEIVIERWSTEAERRRLVESLAKGQRATMEVLRDLPRAGFVRTPGALGWSLHYAHETRGDDGDRRIFLATDRPISAWEAINEPPTIEYPFTFFELRLDASGEGEGRLTLAAQVRASRDGRFVFLENWDTSVKLTQVKRR
jgi:hypothetical protein